jgi:calcineurin-like phosphoesterase
LFSVNIYLFFLFILLIKPEIITRNKPTKYINKIGSSKNIIKKNADKIGVVNIKGATFEASKVFKAFTQNKYEMPFKNAPLIKILIQSLADGKVNSEKD